MSDHRGPIGANISGIHGDVIGVSVSSSGNIIAKTILVENGTINISEERIAEMQNNEYGQSLKTFSETIDKQLKDQQISEAQIKSINQGIDELAKEVMDVKPGKEDQIDYVKKTNVESKIANVIQNVLNVLPQAAETATATFTPLAQFSKLIGKGIQGIKFNKTGNVADIKKASSKRSVMKLNQAGYC